MLATATFGGINAFSKLSYAETLVNGKPCQTTDYTDYEVGANVAVGLKAYEDYREKQGASAAAGIEKSSSSKLKELAIQKKTKQL